MKTRFLVTVFALSVLLAACAPAATATTAPTLPPVANPNEVKVDISGFAFNPGSISI